MNAAQQRSSIGYVQAARRAPPEPENHRGTGVVDERRMMMMSLMHRAEPVSRLTPYWALIKCFKRCVYLTKM